MQGISRFYIPVKKVDSIKFNSNSRLFSKSKPNVMRLTQDINSNLNCIRVQVQRSLSSFQVSFCHIPLSQVQALGARSSSSSESFFGGGQPPILVGVPGAFTKQLNRIRLGH